MKCKFLLNRHLSQTYLFAFVHEKRLFFTTNMTFKNNQISVTFIAHMSFSYSRNYCCSVVRFIKYVSSKLLGAVGGVEASHSISEVNDKLVISEVLTQPFTI